MNKLKHIADLFIENKIDLAVEEMAKDPTIILDNEGEDNLVIYNWDEDKQVSFNDTIIDLKKIYLPSIFDEMIRYKRQLMSLNNIDNSTNTSFKSTINSQFNINSFNPFK